MDKNSDTLFADPLGHISEFRFDREVVAVFPDMIKRSVPGYESIINMTGTLAAIYGKAATNCYDLGCSLGASSFALQRGLQGKNCKIIAVDNSPAMISRCHELLGQQSYDTPIELIDADIQNVEITNASIVVLNFTLQFVPLMQRQKLLEKISRGILPGGILILSEKVAFEDPEHQQLMIELHHNFKRANGYSDLEISQKRTALEDVLLPETLASHRKRLKACGFDAVDVWFQCFNFASIIAMKN